MAKCEFNVLLAWLCALSLFAAASPFSGQAKSSSQAAQSPIRTERPRPTASPKKDDEIDGTEALEAQRRTFAASIIMSLADEARSYKDLALRARVLARSADALWDVDPDGARTLLRRAWEAAEKADAPEDV